MADAPLIPGDWQLPDEFRQRLGSTAGRQRMMESEEQLLLVLHDVPDADSITRHGMLYWRDAVGTWHCSSGQDGIAGLDALLERYRLKLESFDQLEHAAQTANDYSILLEGLAPIARALRNLLEVMEEARKSAPHYRELIDRRDKAYDLNRWAELLYDDAKNSMDVAVVRRAEEQATASHQMLVSAHRLNVLAALFFPFATLGAIFGTTLTDNWTWSHSSAPFFEFITAGAVFGIVLAWFISRDSSR